MSGECLERTYYRTNMSPNNITSWDENNIGDYTTLARPLLCLPPLAATELYQTMDKATTKVADRMNEIMLEELMKEVNRGKKKKGTD